MKSQLIAIVAAVLVVGCGESQQSAPAPETKPVEPVAEAAKPEPPTAKAPDISIHEATGSDGNIEAVKQHLAAGTDVNVKNKYGYTPLHSAAQGEHKEVAEVVELLIAEGADLNAKDNVGWTPLHFADKEGTELLIAAGADVNAQDEDGETPLDSAIRHSDLTEAAETFDLLRKHGGKTSAELKAEGK